MRITLSLAATLLVASACATVADPPATNTTMVSPTTAAPTSTTTTAAPTTTTTTTPTTTTTTTTMPAPGLLPLEPVAGPDTLADGRPATFFAVTDDYEAVEVDTATGKVLRVIGQADDRAAVEAAEVEAASAVIDGVWETRDGSELMVSVCCEPAAGIFFYLGPEGTFALNPAPERTTTGWYAAASPVDASYAVLGYELRLAGPHGELYVECLGDRFGSGAPTYSVDGSAVYWVTESADGWFLEVADFSTAGTVRKSFPLDWVPDGARLTGVATAADGSLVTLQTLTFEGPTEMITLTTSGDVMSSVPIEDGSLLGAYDDSGTYLIYTTGDGVVKWMGGGGTGELGSGYFFATW